MSENIPLYWSAPYQKEILAKITSIKGNSIKLNQNLFYPGGGGQLSDSGYIKIHDKEIMIHNVFKEENDIWHELENISINELEIGQEVLLKVDWKRRYLFMKAHTAQHLISNILKRKFDCETEKANFEEERIFIDVSKEIKLEKIIDAIKEANQLIKEGAEVKSIIVDQETYKSNYLDKVRGKISEEKYVRMIQLGEEGFDLTSCGGIHVKNLSEIKGLFLESMKNLSIKFLVDDKGIENANIQRRLMIKLEEVTSKNGDELVELVNNKLKENEIFQTGNITLLKMVFANISKFSEKIEDKTAAFFYLPEIDRLILQSSAKELEADSFVVLHGRNDVLYCVSSSTLSANTVIEKMKEITKSKGGGNERFAQIDVKNIENPLEIVKKIIKEI